LHQTPDARINYNSSLLGDLTPYAYGEPGYLSSQNAYLNIPHKIQKIVPVVFLPEAKVGAREFFDLSHPIDDGDLAFVLRLERNSLFCTGLKNGSMKRAGLGTAIDPLINLCTLNYILSGMQLGLTHRNGDLWSELLYNLDPHRFAKSVGVDSRDYTENPVELADIIHLVHHCIRPFGVTRGSEKQGGQDEATLSPATWPVSFVVSLTIDGKESNVVNLWHNHDLHAGNDLVLRLKLMPLRPYTLNHYYKGVKRQNWTFTDPVTASTPKYVWQLVPDLLHLDMPTEKEQDLIKKQLASIPHPFRILHGARDGSTYNIEIDEKQAWQDLGYWHIGRSQIMTGKYGVEEYWHNDLANSLRTNHLDITIQPSFCSTPFMHLSVSTAFSEDVRHEYFLGRFSNDSDNADGRDFILPASVQTRAGRPTPLLWTPALGLERLGTRATSAAISTNTTTAKTSADQASDGDNTHGFFVTNNLKSKPASVLLLASMPEEEESSWDSGLGIPASKAKDSRLSSSGKIEDDEEWMGTLEFTDDDLSTNKPGPSITTSLSVQPLPVAASGGGKKGLLLAQQRPTKRGRLIAGGSLLKADGTSETSTVEML
jgi:hypothetical protein